MTVRTGTGPTADYEVLVDAIFGIAATPSGAFSEIAIAASATWQRQGPRSDLSHEFHETPPLEYLLLR